MTPHQTPQGNVRDLNNNPDEILKRAGLDWRVGKAPLAIQGNREVRPFPGKVALVRSDNGYPLAVASDSYHPHHNRELIGMITDFANESGLLVTRAGSFAGGTRIFATAEPKELKLSTRPGDSLRLELRLRTGHEPGTSTKLTASLVRLVCTNGLKINVGSRKYRWNHGADLTPERLAEARDFVLAATAGARETVDTLSALQSHPVPFDTQRASLLAHYDAEGFGRLVQDMIGEGLIESSVQPNALDTRTIQAVNERFYNDGFRNPRLEANRLLDNVIEASGNRVLNRMLDALTDQPGLDPTIQGTWAQPVNAVTYVNSHLRGRGETGEENALFGSFASDSAAYFETAQQWAETVQARFINT